MFKLKKQSLIYVVLSVFLLVLFSFLVAFLKSPSLDILKYPLAILNLIRREIGGIIFYHRNLIQNERLKKEIDLLKSYLKDAKEEHLENKRLKDLLSFKQKSPYKLIAARVIGRAADNWSCVIIVDKGRYNGIKRGQVVITYLGLVGRVIETAESTSKIMLINHPDLGVSAMVERSRQEGLVSGTLGESLVMRYLPKDSDIRISDAVVTSGLTESYPKGLLVGKVVGIGDEFSGLSLYAVIKPVVNFSALEEVLIIIS